MNIEADHLSLLITLNASVLYNRWISCRLLVTWVTRTNYFLQSTKSSSPIQYYFLNSPKNASLALGVCTCASG